VTRRKFIAGNWKMNLNRQQARELAASVAEYAPGEVDIAVFPPTIWLAHIAGELEGSGVRPGAQNCWRAQKGAFTGEISPAMIAEIAPLVIIGHSERRQLLHEVDALIRDKIDAALEAGLEVILCVGETLETRNEGNAVAHVSAQLESALAGRAPGDLESITIAYEPIWAIGTGEAATPADAQEMSAAIRALMRTLNEGYAERGRILYGGSVTPGNAVELLGQPDVDGALVGGASLKADDFKAIVTAAI
jgi:triosephosphate isomerase